MKIIDILISNSESDTVRIGLNFANLLKSSSTVAITGELGAGKTELIKGICKYFHIDEPVTSPTFTIMNQYSGLMKGHHIKIYHIDLYRIKKISELDEIGFSECIASNEGIKLVEWSEKAGERFADPDFQVEFKTDLNDENKREIKISVKD